jgi:DNA transformation protein
MATFCFEKFQKIVHDSSPLDRHKKGTQQMTQHIINKDHKNPFVSHVLELMENVGPVQARKMFGGYGLFLQDLMFALIADEMLYFKVDTKSEQDFQDLNLAQFTYNKKGRVFAMSYYQAPEESLEDMDEMQLWGMRAFEAALRAAKKKQNR